MSARIAGNVIAFQAAWLVIVGGAAIGREWLSLLAVIVATSLHLALAAAARREAALLLLVAAIGTSWDSVWASLGWIDYRGAAPVAGAAPYWMTGLWLVFATTLNVTLRWLRERIALAVALGALLGPLAYAAGDALGALELARPSAALGAQAAGWGALLPLALALAARFDGVSEAHGFAGRASHV